MKIYKKIVIDIESSQVIEEESYDYIGSIALCKGGGKSVTYQTIDKEYNRRMANIAEAQQRMAEEYYNYWKWGALAFTGQVGTVSQKVSSSYSYPDKLKKHPFFWLFSHFLPKKEKSTQLKYKYIAPKGIKTSGGLLIDKQGAPIISEANLGLMRTKAQMELIPMEESLLAEQMGTDIELEKYRQRLLPRLYELATTKIEPEKMAAQAQAQVEQSFAKAGETVARTLGRYGLSPDSGAFGAGLRQVQLAKAMGIAGAREEAKRYAKELQWQRGLKVFE